MKITMSKTQWTAAGKQTGWLDTGGTIRKRAAYNVETARLTDEQIRTVDATTVAINQLADGDEDLMDILSDAIGEQLEANQKGYKGKGIVMEFAGFVNDRINTWRTVLDSILKSGKPHA